MVFMRKLLTTLAFISLASASVAAPVMSEVEVVLGPKKFLDGDVIRIDSVRATSERLEQGDTVEVVGRYRLDSSAEATLALYLTQTEGDGSEETEAGQKVDARRGWKEFKCSITIKHRGVLHLTFYDKSSGSPFGGVYFSAAANEGELQSMSVDHYKAKR